MCTANIDKNCCYHKVQVNTIFCNQNERKVNLLLTIFSPQAVSWRCWSVNVWTIVYIYLKIVVSKLNSNKFISYIHNVIWTYKKRPKEHHLHIQFTFYIHEGSFSQRFPHYGALGLFPGWTKISNLR